MKQQSKYTNVAGRITAVLFIIYLIALCWILLFKLGVEFSYMRERKANLIPFNEPSIWESENILNVLVFVPLGVYAAVLFIRWSFGKKLLFIFLLSSLIEVLQYSLRVGAFDVTDVITNTSGGVIGLMVVIAIEKAFNDSFKAQKFINRIAAIGTVLMIVLLVLLKMNMLPVKYQ